MPYKCMHSGQNLKVERADHVSGSVMSIHRKAQTSAIFSHLPRRDIRTILNVQKPLERNADVGTILDAFASVATNPMQMEAILAALEKFSIQIQQQRNVEAAYMHQAAEAKRIGNPTMESQYVAAASAAAQIRLELEARSRSLREILDLAWKHHEEKTGAY
jgi:hypothetical protein